MRWIWGTAGFVMIAIGLAALLVPVLPTTPFLVLAAACLMRASPKLERWLVEHPLLGAPIRDWRAGRGVRRSVKLGILVLTALGMALALWSLREGPAWARYAVIGGGLLSAAIVLSLPTRAQR